MLGGQSTEGDISSPTESDLLQTTKACLSALNVVGNPAIVDQMENEENNSVYNASDMNVQKNPTPEITPGKRKLGDDPLRSNKQPNLSNPRANTRNAYEVNKNNRYTNIDNGPYTVIVENSADGNIGKLHRLTLGKLLFRALLNEGKLITDIRQKGKNRVQIQVANYALANKIVELEMFKNDNLQAYIPESSLFRKGVMRNVDLDILTSEILVEAVTECTIVDVKRITKKSPDSDARVDTKTVILTFRGQKIPNYISLYGARCYIKPYVYNVTMCNNCLRYGHTQNLCRSSGRCAKCGATEHKEENCDAISAYCVHCEGVHWSTDRTCSVYVEQKKIKTFMAVNNVSYIF